MERLVLPLWLPRDPSMMPSLEIAVLDKRLVAFESLVGTASVDLSRCTKEGKGPGGVNVNYRLPGTPTAEEAEGGNPFMAAGSTPAMRAAFRRRSKRLKAAMHQMQRKKEVGIDKKRARKDGAQTTKSNVNAPTSVYVFVILLNSLFKNLACILVHLKRDVSRYAQSLLRCPLIALTRAFYSFCLIPNPVFCYSKNLPKGWRGNGSRARQIGP